MKKISRSPTIQDRSAKGGIDLKTYEIICILNPNLANESVEEKITNWQGIIQKMGGEITKISRWGKRNLAYEVKKQRQGYFVLMHLKATHETKDEIERQFKISDEVIKFQSIVLKDRDIKHAEATADKIQASTSSFQKEYYQSLEEERHSTPVAKERFMEEDDHGQSESGDDDEDYHDSGDLNEDSDK